MLSGGPLARAAAFVLRGQDADGAWRDFALPPGPSTSWTTAYIATRLVESWPDAGAAVGRARAFLRASVHPGHGWGYNAGCKPDADSTACALLAVPDAHPRHAAALARFATPEGGFRTYDFITPGHEWARPHAEVTATALRALVPVLGSDHVLIRRGVAWLATQDAAYWWETPAYLSRELARLRLILPHAPVLPAPAEVGTSAFDTALRLEVRLDPASAEALLASQRPDGSWASAPILRLPDPYGGRTRVFADERQLFTTATVLSALVQFEGSTNRRSAKPHVRRLCQ
jgi:hypothetical protein